MDIIKQRRRGILSDFDEAGDDTETCISDMFGDPIEELTITQRQHDALVADEADDDAEAA